MKKTTKKILGCVGLAGVLGMTAVAYQMPNPDVIAQNSGEVTIQVSVVSPSGEVAINTPKDGDNLLDSVVNVSHTYNNVDKIEYTLSYTENGEDKMAVLPVFFPTDKTGTHDFSIDLSGYGGYNSYTLTVTATGESAFAEDAVSFSYLPIKSKIVGFESNNDPILELSYDKAKVCSVTVQAYDKNNRALFSPIYTYNIPTPPPTENTIDLTLPFGDYAAASSDYRIEVTPYDCSSKKLSDSTILSHTYTSPDAPEVPNTGETSEDINFSKAEYLIAGSAIFLGISAFAVFLIKRKRN